ncbi:hypothetical protein J4206_00180 [Candidatus Woesearchaeota archaeon]|nr:hypothetical protein [Candidatus Woesearchaeota archaeon]
MGSHSFIKRGKKADLSINIIVIAIIALLVLVVIIYIFNSQTKKVTGGYTGITDKALAPKCEGFLGENGNCKKTSCDSKEESEVPLPEKAAVWQDCDEKGAASWKCCKSKAPET